MTKASDNVFPRLLISEGGSTSTPAAAQVTVYAKANGLLYSKDDAGTETALGGGAGGSVATDAIWDAAGDLAVGTGANTAAKLTKGSDGDVLTMVSGAVAWDPPAAGADLVQVASGAGSIVIPGLSASPDAVPGSPSADDSEFAAGTGWTALGTLDTNNVTDFKSHLHIKRALVAVGVVGLYKAIPSGGMPFTVTCKMSDAAITLNNQFAGLMLLEGSPGKIASFAPVYNAGPLLYNMYRWTNLTTFSTAVAGLSIYGPTAPYLRLIVASSSDVSFQFSPNGFVWSAAIAASQDPSLTVANVGVVIGDLGAAHTVEAVFDWIRFT